MLSCCVAASVAAAQQPKRPAPKPPAKPAAPAPKPAAPVAKPAFPPDLVVKTQYSSNDKTTLTTISSKGARQRIDYGTEMSVVVQCDTGKLLQIADQGQRFLTTSLDAPPATDTNAKPPKKGGTIAIARTVTLTGERKEVFGQPAKRARIVVTKTPSADACDKHRERVESDGWFIEPPAVATCSVPSRKPSFAITNGCRDEITYTDADATAGYPVAYTAVTTGDDPPSPGNSSGASARPVTLTMEVTSFERQTLPESLFVAPDDYKEVKTLADLTATVKKAGNVRVGVVAVTTKLKEQLALQELSDALVVSLNDADVDAVSLEATSAASAIEEARLKKVDYLLVTEVTDLRKPQRGLVGRVTGARDFGAKVDFMLVAPGAVTPALSSSERTGASNMQIAVKTAQTAYKFATPMGLLGSRFNFMQTYMAMAGGQNGTATAVPTSDPVINTLFQVLNTTTGANQPQEMAESADAAVASAMEREVAAVAAKLKK
jgi:hypothetical protein